MSKTKIIIQGHRGARGFLPENTIESCIEAVRRGIDGLEIDVVVSKDNQIVVSHEPWMSSIFCSYPNGQPVLNEKNWLYRMNYADIKTFDCGLRPHPMFKNQQPTLCYKPTLYELVGAVEAYCQQHNLAIPFFNIEIKSHITWYHKLVPLPTTFVNLIQKEIQSIQMRGYLSKFYISSFDARLLRVVKSRIPAVSIAFLTENRFSVAQNLNRLGFVPQIYSPYYLFINRKMVIQAHKLGIKLMTWTVNDKKTANTLIKLGIDGIITDYPGILCE